MSAIDPKTGLKKDSSSGQMFSISSEDRQKDILMHWINDSIQSRGLKIKDLFEDLKDGFILHNLCEILSGTDLKQYGKLSKGKMRIQLVANMNVVFKYLRSEQGIRLFFVGPSDVVDGNEKLVMGLVWSLMEFFSVLELCRGGVDLATIKLRLLHWLLRYSTPPGGTESLIQVHDLSKSLQDGRVLFAVLHHFDPAACAAPEERGSGDPCVDLEAALEDMHARHGVEKLLDPSAVRKQEAKTTVPYLIHLVKVLSVKHGPEACMALTDPRLDNPPPSKEAAEQALREAEEAAMEARLQAAEAAVQDTAALNAKVRELTLAKEKIEAAQRTAAEEVALLRESNAKLAAQRRRSSAPASPSSPTGRAEGSLAFPDTREDGAGGATLTTLSPEGGGAAGAELEEALAAELALELDAQAAAHAAQLDEAEARHAAREADLERRLLAAEGMRTEETLRRVQRLGTCEAELEAAKAAVARAEAAAAAQEAAFAVEREAFASKVRAQDAERRKLHNTIQELRGNVRVFARVRAFLPALDGVDPTSEAGRDYEPWLRCDPDGSTLHALQPDPLGGGEGAAAAAGGGGEDAREVSHSFSYDRVFGQRDDQAAVFLEVSEFVQSALDGYNVCLFSYGQTGSGKTFTMTGSPDGEERGIIPRAIEQVAARKAQLEEAGWSFEMEISFLEIYCETIKDLLGDGENAAKYKIVSNEYGQNVVQNVEMVPVDPADTGSVRELMQHAASLRSTTATKMNAESSRSHSIFTLHLTAHHLKQGVTLHGQLNLVDLAGSERIEKSGVAGQALTEAKFINKSLSALAGVFLALGKKNSHVPFRDSKLTELLHPALSGSGKTLMMLNLSPAQGSLSESVSSLRFGTNVNACELGRAKRVIKRLGAAPISTAGGDARGRPPKPSTSSAPYRQTMKSPHRRMTITHSASPHGHSNLSPQIRRTTMSSQKAPRNGSFFDEDEDGDEGLNPLRKSTGSINIKDPKSTTPISARRRAPGVRERIASKSPPRGTRVSY